ncbi:NAD(P)-binding domain-containing protein [Nitrosomonas communis]|uniref:NAD binding domain of 6-phosphogluconate dehydrogenase n=1 Tax=Nitrosomonas communis TaxID=44574 RepID=A0A1I4MA67_9PROT|nr:NAD(P)-binding domain-containing protein [Nitrosomonas communis]SFM00114.1 NAD binding domain of 6-phosphogluconate dehydrogenase [Nitrosomonas communis]
MKFGIMSLGQMGDNMAHRFARKGMKIVVMNRTFDVAEAASQGNRTPTAIHTSALTGTIRFATEGHSISKSKLTLSTSPCRIIHTICDSPSRHF